ncbi:zinc finger BED domain-containing protein RICESLEEPER 2-like [Lathyrus oleraceus]|uniref:zinc finger BED domain-containing protein RICESLEEPER 2-like n=1 Tax=Pisum sativum TaxID=3888 RepID=UPI0021D1B27F|nr:zinc finger BED domain-containing protein RICESLEEPER 2-like [Pisum sativum]
MSTDSTQTILTYPSVDGKLVQVSSRFDKKACRSALSVFVVLDEQPFSAVEGEGVALTTYCWTSIQNLNYLTLTAHFVDKEWKYQKRIISFTVIPNHQGETVGRKIEEVLKDWGIRNVSTITVDNATSNDVVVTYLKRKIANKNGLMGDGECFHMRCSTHILNLVVNEGLKDKHLSVTSVRDAVRFVKSSPHRATKFKECVEFARITCKKLVCLDVSTRWNATYLMLEVAEKFQLAFEKLEDEESSYRELFGKGNPPSKDDWDIARAYSAFLKLFYEATKTFFTSHNGSPDKMNKMIYFGIILDPRYKLSYIEWALKDMYGVGSKFGSDLPLGSGGNNVSNDETNAFAARSSLMARADAFEQHLKEQDSIDQQNELEVYNSSKCVKRDPNFDILVWWKRNSIEYPILSTMAKDILATPVSTVASESAFSTGGRVIETYRSSLTTEMAEALICTQNWLRPSFTYFKDMNLMEDFELSKDIVTEFQQMSLAAKRVSGVSSSQSQPQPSGCA